MKKNSMMKKIKTNWKLILTGFVILVSLAFFLDYVILGIIDDEAFTAVGFNNFLYTFTFIINGLFILYNLVMVFWKKKTSGMLYAFASASFLIFFYIIRLCLIWY